MVCTLRTLLPLVLVLKLSRHKASIASNTTPPVFIVNKDSTVELRGCAYCSAGGTAQTAEIIDAASMVASNSTQLLVQHYSFVSKVSARCHVLSEAR
jgi:hypothetical protein